MTDSSFVDLVVSDYTERCPYLPSEMARMPLRLPVAPVSREELDARLAAGERRSGQYFYRTECPHCSACEPLRIPVKEFRPNATQRRTLRKGKAAFTCDIVKPTCSAEHVDLYNRHRQARGLERNGPIDEEGFRDFLVESRCESWALEYRHAGRLAIVAIVDRAATSLSAVYTCFDPELASFSPGVYSILRQIEFCRKWRLPTLYLGLYIAPCPHMSYKARYLPHERLIQGVWRRFEAT